MMRARLVSAAAVASLTALGLAACGASGDDDPVRAGARAAVEAYVAAIEAGDLETATAMTAEGELASSEADVVDVAAALPDAVEPMQDAWIDYSGTDFLRLDESEPDATSDVVWWMVSYRVGEATGSDDVEVALVGDDPADLASWLVVDPLLVEATAYVNADDVIASTLSGIEVPMDDGATTIRGYPGVYLHEATSLDSDVPADAFVEPVRLHLGAELGPRWDDRLVRLEVAAT